MPKKTESTGYLLCIFIAHFFISLLYTHFLPITTSPFLSLSAFLLVYFLFLLCNQINWKKIIYVCVPWNGEWEKAIKYRNYCVIMQKSLLYHHFHQIIPGLCVYTMHIPVFYYKLFDFFIMPVYSVFVQNLSLTFFVLIFFLVLSLGWIGWIFLLLSLSDRFLGWCYTIIIIIATCWFPFLSTWLFPTWPPFHFEHELNNQQKPTGILIFNSSHKNYYIVSW